MNVSRIKLVGVALVIFAATVWVCWPSTRGEFLREDDLEYLRQSEQWNGLTWNAVKWAFTSMDMYYHPLPRLFYALSYQICGTNAAGHHATSVLLHALNAALVFGFLWTLLEATALSSGERLTVALWVAAVFAIHPLQAESVAWMSVRTQLLCTMFCIACLWAYATGVRRWVVWGLYVVALLCKPTAVSVPFVMLAIDYYPLRRHERLGWRRLVWEKALMIVLAGLAGMATVRTEWGPGPIAPGFATPLPARVLRLFESLTFYLAKLVWPSHLSPTYLLDMTFSPWTVIASGLTVIVITAVVARERQRLPGLVAAWGAYVMLLLPMSGLVPTGRPVVEMRYAYVAMLPALLVAGAAGVWVWRRSATAGRAVLVGLLAGQLCAFTAGIRRLIPDWHNDETMHRSTLAEFPDSEQANRELATEFLDAGRAGEALEYAQRGVEIAPQLCEPHVLLGLVFSQLGRLTEAVAQDEQALQIDPDSARAHFGFGVALTQMGREPEAVEQFEQALRINPDYAEAHCNLGIALVRTGKIEEAIQHYEQALRIRPDFADAHTDLGVALAQTGKFEEAIQHYKQALRINPYYAEAHTDLGVALVQTGKIDEAIQHFEQALRLNPDSAEAHYNLGIVLPRTGKTGEAIQHYEQALRIKPDYAEAHYNLAIALTQAGKFDEAIQHFEQVVRIKPDYAEAHYKLAIALAQTGKTEEAIAHFEQVLRIEPDNAAAHNNLGIALVRSGRMPEAIEHLEQALRINPQYAEAHSNLGLALYRTGKHEEAIEHYQQALRINPDYADAHVNLGNGFLQEGKVSDAIGQYEQALRTKPDNAAAHYSLGIALGQAGRIPEAIEHLKQALRIKPDFTQAQSALAQLQARQ